MECNKCNLCVYTQKQMTAQGPNDASVVIVSHMPSHVDTMVGGPLTGLQELIESECYKCIYFYKCYGYFLRNRPSIEWNKECVGYLLGSNNMQPSYEQAVFNTGGQMFDRFLHDLMIDRKTLKITTALKCCTPGGRAPMTSEIDNCREQLMWDIFGKPAQGEGTNEGNVKPKVIVALGELATYAVLGAMVEDYGEVDFNGIKLLSTYNPEAIIRLNRMRIKQAQQSNPKEQESTALIKGRSKHLKATLIKAKEYSNV